MKWIIATFMILILAMAGILMQQTDRTVVLIDDTVVSSGTGSGSGITPMVVTGSPSSILTIPSPEEVTSPHNQQISVVTTGSTETKNYLSTSSPIQELPVQKKETPRPGREHYVPVTKATTTAYPYWYNADVLSKGTITDWLQVLPESQRSKSAYIIVRRLGMIVPLVTSSASESDFFASKAHALLEQGAVMHPRADGGPIIVGGHTSYYLKSANLYKTIFQSLPLLRKSDTIDIYRRSGSTRSVTSYSVHSSSVVTPDQTQHLTEGGSNELILYGCYPLGSLRKRIVVKATAL